MVVVDVLVVTQDEMGDALPGQSSSVHPKRDGGGEIGLLDQPRFGEREVPHRRQVVKIEVACPGGFQLLPGRTQFLVLSLQLDLMHPKFVKYPASFSGPQ